MQLVLATSGVVPLTSVLKADGTAKPSFTLSSVRDETTLNDEELAKNSGAACQSFASLLSKWSIENLTLNQIIQLPPVPRPQPHSFSILSMRCWCTQMFKRKLKLSLIESLAGSAYPPLTSEPGFSSTLLVCSPDMFFSYADLPYLDSIIKEISRWRPVAPISVPHRLTKDDVYKGQCLLTFSLW